MVYNMVHDLRKNTVKVHVFFVVHQKSTHGERNIVHQKFKFFEPWFGGDGCVWSANAAPPNVKCTLREC